ncbi:50S ribosomal protein L1, partial [Plesiomonas shigelloides]|nr:50S ribosomal protein L1 [Plesiomonas shigelloides]
MAKLTKRIRVLRDNVASTQHYAITEALALPKELAPAQFFASFAVSVNLGIDARQSDQKVRGTTELPPGTARTVPATVIHKGANVEAAKAAGSDPVAMEDLADRITQGEKNIDVMIESPEALRVLGKLEQNL